jgi:outer membrane lipoprotein-sorting protein
VVLYLGEQLYGFFKFVHQFAVRDNKNGNTTDIYVDAKKLVVLSKITKDAQGMEIIKEIYEDYKNINDILVPARVNVFARAAAGVIRNTTEYSDIKLNYGIPDAIFRLNLPAGVEKKFLNNN